MAQEYSRNLLRISLAQICQNLGWNSIHSTPLELLTDVLERYLSQLARVTHRYSEQFGRSDPRLEDVQLAFGHLGVQLGELEEYMKYVDPLPFAHDVVSFPAPKRNNLQFPDPDTREIQQREEHVPIYLPHMFPAEEGEEVVAPVPGTPEHPSQDGVSPMEISPGSGEKRPLTGTSPGDLGLPFKRPRMTTSSLPEEALHSQYEMRSVLMSQTGHLTPTAGQGKLPDPKTPPQGFKQIIVVRDGRPKVSSDAPVKVIRPEVIETVVSNTDRITVIPRVQKVLVDSKKKDSQKSSSKTLKFTKTQSKGQSKSPARSKSPKNITSKDQLKEMLLQSRGGSGSSAKDKPFPAASPSLPSNEQDLPIDLSMKISPEDSAKKSKSRLPPHLQLKEEFEKKMSERDDARSNVSQEQRLVIAENLKMKSEEKLVKERERSAAIDDTIDSVIKQSSQQVKHYDNKQREAMGDTEPARGPSKAPDKPPASESDDVWRVKEGSLSVYSDEQSISDSIDAVIKGGQEEDGEVRTDASESESSTIMSPDGLVSPTTSPSKRGRKPKRGKGARGRGVPFPRGRGSPYGKGTSPRGRGASPKGRGASPRASESQEESGDTGLLEKQQSEEYSVYDFPDSPVHSGRDKHNKKVPTEVISSPKPEVTSPGAAKVPLPMQFPVPVPSPEAPPVLPEVITIALPQPVKDIKKEPTVPKDSESKGEEKPKQKEKNREKSKDRDKSKEHRKDKKKKKKKERDKDRDKERKEKHKSKDGKEMSPMPSFPKLKIRFSGSSSSPGSFSISTSEPAKPSHTASPQHRAAQSPLHKPEIPKLKIKAMPPKPASSPALERDSGRGKDREGKNPTSQAWVSTQIKSEPEEVPAHKTPSPAPQVPAEPPRVSTPPLAPLFAPLPQMQKQKEDQSVKMAEEDSVVKNESADEDDGSVEGEKVLTVVQGKVIPTKQKRGRKRRGSTRKVKDNKPLVKSIPADAPLPSLFQPESEVSPSPPSLFPVTNVPSPVTIPALKAAPPPPSPPVPKKSPPKPLKLPIKETRPPSPLFKDILPPKNPPPKAAKFTKSPRKSSPKKSPKRVSPPVKKNLPPLFAPPSPKKPPSPEPLPEMEEDQDASPPRQGSSSIPRTPSPSRVSTPSPSGPSSPGPLFTPGASPARRSPSPFMIPPTPAFPTRTISPAPSPPSPPAPAEVPPVETEGQATDDMLPPMPPPALPPMPPPSAKKGMQRTVVAETIGTFVNAAGEKIWICPACKMPDDGSPMIGCDLCDDWYHWPCVNIKEEPAEDESWFCSKCKPSKKAPKKRGRKKKKPY